MGRDSVSDSREIRGFVFDIQRYSLHDGPGLRTNVFLKGCTLDCAWCSNPEAKDPRPQTAFFERHCFLCGDCLAVCPNHAIELRDGRLTWDASACTSSGDCVRVCPARAFTIIGKEMSAAEVVAAALRDTAFYAGQGGLTLTGGDPTYQPAFAQAILRLAKSEGLHTAIETCGACNWPTLAGLLPYLDLVLYDLKHMDSAIHRKYTGGDNHGILENLRQAASREVELAVRVPLVPGFNTNQPSLEALAQFIRSLDGARPVHLLPYHALGRPKYQALGMDFPMEDTLPMTEEMAEDLAQPFRACGLDVIVGG